MAPVTATYRYLRQWAADSLPPNPLVSHDTSARHLRDPAFLTRALRSSSGPCHSQLSGLMIHATVYWLHGEAARSRLAEPLPFKCFATDVMAERLCVVHTGTAPAGCSSRWRSA